MKTRYALPIFFLFSILVISILPNKAQAQASCEVIGVYSKLEAKDVLCVDGSSIDKCDYVLVRQNIGVGTQILKVNRVSSNVYQVYGQNQYIVTKYCSEYTYNAQAVLQITTTSTFSTIGKLIFTK